MGSGLGGMAEGHGPGLHPQIGLGMDVGRVEADISEPGADRIQIDAGLKEVVGAVVTDRVRCDPPLGDGARAAVRRTCRLDPEPCAGPP